jgi:hypothetical protein
MIVQMGSMCDTSKSSTCKDNIKIVQMGSMCGTSKRSTCKDNIKMDSIEIG